MLKLCDATRDPRFDRPERDLQHVRDFLVRMIFEIKQREGRLENRVDPTEAFMGPEFAKWYASGGRLGREPTDPNLKRILELFRGAAGQKDDERNKTAQEIWKILVDQQYSIGTVGQSPALMGVRLASRKLANIPSRACIAQHCRTPGTSRPETWFYRS